MIRNKKLGLLRKNLVMSFFTVSLFSWRKSTYLIHFFDV
jgi:hypothetical protein